MESKLDRILKELQDLKLRDEGLENKNTREASRDKKRLKNTDRRKDEKDDIIRKIKINPPTFNGILNPKIFSDWIANLDFYFD